MRLRQKSFLFLSLSGFSCLQLQASAPQLHGRVVNLTGLPIAQARVQFQALAPTVLTDAEGKFEIPLPTQVPPPPLTAGKEGYFNGIWEQTTGTNVPEIVLKPIPTQDNPTYAWIDPDPITNRWHQYVIGITHRLAKIFKDERWIPRSGFQCGTCHPPLYKEWQKDRHSGSARNPIVLKFFEDNTAPAFHLDFPNSAGNCATCHAPADSTSYPWNTSLTQLTPVGQKGVSCDICHKVRDVTLDHTGGYPGVLSMKFMRPHGRHQLFLGPFPDVTAGPDSFSPLFKDSRLCASCHQARFWGELTYGSYTEWLQSPQARQGIHCVDCHMKPTGQLSNLAPERGGLTRDPTTLATHQMKTALDLNFFREALKTQVRSHLTPHSLVLNVSLENIKAAHAIPTDFVGRNLILWVQATDATGRGLKLLRGARIPSWGGDLAGQPGQGFAKVLQQDIKTSFTTSSIRKVIRPAPHWLQISLHSDTRLFANQPKHIRFEFARPSNISSITFHLKLLYRRLFYEWAIQKQIPLQQFTLWETQQMLPLSSTHLTQITP